MPSGTRPVVQVAEVYKDFGTQAVLRGADLVVGEGEMVALMGRSGSGKSTLLHLVGGLDRDYRGGIVVCGRDLGRLSDAELAALRSGQIGFVFQAFHLLDHLSCLENVTLPAAFAPGGESEAGAAARGRQVLERVGLGARWDELPGALSGGQKQRVAIARALFRRPRLLLCDEPTGNLDAHTGAQILDLFRALNQEEGLSLLLVTHEERTARLAGRVLTIEEGRVVPC